MPHAKYLDCIEACNNCAVACQHCAASCLQEENVSEMVRCIALDQACADICFQASKLMAAGSEFTERFCALCAEVCEACGQECEKHIRMEHCRECAEACFECARQCREMAGMAV